MMSVYLCYKTLFGKLCVYIQVILENLERGEAVIANFPAHAGEDCKIGALAFDPRCVCLCCFSINVCISSIVAHCW